MSISPCSIKTGQVTFSILSLFLKISLIANLTHFPIREPATSFIDVKGDISTSIPGFFLAAKNDAGDDPSDLPEHNYIFFIESKIIRQIFINC